MYAHVCCGTAQVAAKKKAGDEAVEEIAAVQAIKAAIEAVETRQEEA